MKIKKKEQSVGILGKITSLFSNSKTDTYSCDYINNKFDDLQIIKLEVTEKTSLGYGAYNKLAFGAATNIVGNELSYDATNIEVKVGQNINIIEISGVFMLQNSKATTGILCRITKNGVNIAQISVTSENADYFNNLVVVTPLPINVTKDDVISATFYGEGYNISCQPGSYMTIKKIK